MIHEREVIQQILCDQCGTEFVLSWTKQGEHLTCLYCPFCGDRVSEAADGTPQQY